MASTSIHIFALWPDFDNSMKAPVKCRILDLIRFVFYTFTGKVLKMRLNTIKIKPKNICLYVNLNIASRKVTDDITPYQPIWL